MGLCLLGRSFNLSRLFLYFLLQDGRGKFTDIGGAVFQHSFSIFFRPALQGNEEGCIALIVVDAEAGFGPTAVGITPDQSDGGASLYELPWSH